MFWSDGVVLSGETMLAKVYATLASY